jgi:TonB family protein
MKAATAPIQLRAIRLRGVRQIRHKVQAIPLPARKPDNTWESITSNVRREENKVRRPIAVSLCLFGLLAGLMVIQKEKTQSAQFDSPSVVSTVEAVYPLQSTVWGTVVLEVSLDDQGTVTGVRVVHGIPSLTEPAEFSVRQWKFKPAQLNGEPVSSKIAVAFSFVPPNIGPRI